MNQLTVLIPCKNEIENLEECLASVRAVADEILIADSGSQDGTLDLIQRQPDCRLIQQQYIHSGDFKNWAIPQARHSWVLVIDADERVTPALAVEIQQRLAEASDVDGYWIPRDNYFLGQRIRYSGWQSDRCLRLFRRDHAVYVGDNDHAEVQVASGRVARLKAALQHDTFANYDSFFRKLNRYTSYQAHIWSESGRRTSFVDLLVAGPLRFFHAYVLRGGFLDGKAGLQVCALTGFYSFMKRARLWERNLTNDSHRKPNSTQAARAA